MPTPKNKLAIYVVGDVGTGKTTIARMLGEILAQHVRVIDLDEAEDGIPSPEISRTRLRAVLGDLEKIEIGTIHTPRDARGEVRRDPVRELHERQRR